jgi:lipoprotein NlpD
MAMLAVLCLSACAPLPPTPIERRPSPVFGAQAPPIYEVQRGDTLASIAFRYGLDWRDIARWNRLDAPYTIRVGQELRLVEPPSSSTRIVSAPAPSPTPSRAPEVRPAPTPAPSGTAPTPSNATRTVANIAWQWPTAGEVVRPFDAAATRRGLGIGGEVGQAVVATADGQVVYSGTALIGYGELIIIQHSGALLSAYGHNRRRLVEEGARVQAGQPIAELGLNDRDQPMLHFEIRQDGQPVDPRRFLPPR